MGPTPPVEDPEIRDVRSVKTGRVYNAPTLIRSWRWDRYVRICADVREAMQRGQPRLRCALCGIPVYFVNSTEKRVFLRHQSEDGRCTAVTRDGLTENDLREIIYRGRQESWQHIETKRLIEEGLRGDADFSDVAVEATWRAAEGMSRRRPDVSATWRGHLRVAFEAQLTTTFLDVVLERRAFYQQEGALLVWVLRRFDPANRRMTEEHILFSNNSNVLVVDGATAAASRAAGRFMVRVHHRTMSEDGQHGWAETIAPFADLTLDRQGQLAFLYDYGRAEARAAEAEARRLEEKKRQLHEERARKRDRLRSEVMSFLVDREAGTYEGWRSLRNELRDAGVSTHGMAEDLLRVGGLICGLASGRAGAVVGFGYTRLIEVANYLHDNHRGAVCAFLALVDDGGHRPALASARPGKWAAREAAVMAARDRNDPSVRLPDDARPLVGFLFPELKRPRGT